MKVKLSGILLTLAVVVGIVVLCPTRDRGVVDGDEQKAVGLIAEVAPALTVAQASASVARASVGCSTNQTLTSRGTLSYVVTTVEPVEKSMRLAIEATGAKILTHLSGNEVLVEAAPSLRQQLSTVEGVSGVRPRLPEGKVAPELRELLAAGVTDAEVTIVSLDATDVDLLRKMVVANGGELLTGCLNGETSFRAKVPVAFVTALAERGEVQWLERFERPHLMNDVAVNPAAMNVRPVWTDLGLNGAGQIVTTSDSGISTTTNEEGVAVINHPDLVNQVVGFKVVDKCVDRDVIGHGTHTAGSIVGDGTMSTNEVIRGTAWGAKLWAWFCSDGGRAIYTPTNIVDLLQPEPESFTAHIHSASWGSSVRGKYTDECQQFDTYLWKHPDYLPVISAGNDGRSGSGTIGSPAAAKNVLAVGATQNLRRGFDGGWGNGDPTQTAVYSSRGPCQTGRIKPDIAAPGSGVLSTRSLGVDYDYGIYDDYYAYDSGTSMACPLTAGAVTLVRQWLVEKMGFEDTDEKRPTAALMKAVITGGAKGTLTPNNEQGWGRVDLAETLFPSNRAVKLIDRIPFKEGTNFVYVVETTNAAPIDVQLVWIDHPGTSLINDLDLTVEARVNGLDKIWYGNGGSEPDAENNLESVRLETAEPTVYVITVNCRKIAYDYTDGGAAALYIRGAFDPEATPEEPKYVRIRETDAEYRLLDQALAAVQDGQTIELLSAATLRKPVKLEASCSICATNEDAKASAVRFNVGARLTVPTGRELALTNFCVTNQPEKAVFVETNATLKIAGFVDVGTVDLKDVKGLDLAGELSRSIYVVSPSNKVDEAFATYSCDPMTARASAMYLLNPASDELGGFAGYDGKITWSPDAPVPDDVAVARLEVAGVPTNFRSLMALMRHLPESVDVGIQVVKDVSLELEDALQLTNRTMTIVGEGMPAPTLTITQGHACPANKFVCLADSELVLSNVTIKGSLNAEKAQQELFHVDGGALTLGAGTAIEGHVTTDPCPYGAIALLAGEVTLKDGARIANCTASSSNTGRGGAVSVHGGTLHLFGATITNCTANTKFGQSLYVHNEHGESKVELSGKVVVDTPTYVFSRDLTITPFEVVGPLEAGSILQIDHLTKLADPAKDALSEGKLIATVADGVTFSEAEVEATRRAFVNTKHEELGAEFSGQTLVWGEKLPDPPEPGLVRVIQGEVTNEFMTVEEAFTSITEDAMVILLDDIAHDEPLTVAHTVTLTSGVGGPFELYGTGSLEVKGGALTLTDVRVAGPKSIDSFGDVLTDIADQPMIYVEDGSLTLGAGAYVNAYMGVPTAAEPRNDLSAIVLKGSTFTMLEGSVIEDCYNLHYDAVKGDFYDGVKGDSGCGAAVYAYSESTVKLLGGKIANCWAEYGAVFLQQGSKGYVGENFTLKDNTTLQYLIDEDGFLVVDEDDFPVLLDWHDSDLVVDENSTLEIASPLTGSIGRDYVASKRSDTNYVAQVSDWRGWEFSALTNSVTAFFHDTNTAARAVLVTNATDTALVVWSTAIQDGLYTAKDGKAYGLMGEMPEPSPGPGPGPGPDPETATPGPIAFTKIAMNADRTEVTLAFTNAVQWCNYAIFGTNTLTGGFVIEGVAPVTNFQWQVTEPKVELTLPINGNLFWKATAAEGLVP